MKAIYRRRPAIEFADVEVLSPFLHPRLKELLSDVLTYIPGPFTVTSAWRPDDPGIHHIFPLRAIDIRSRHLTQEEIQLIVDHVGSNWVYDPTRPDKPCILYHDVGYGEHFHLQVHDRTERRKGK